MRKHLPFRPHEAAVGTTACADCSLLLKPSVGTGSSVFSILGVPAGGGLLMQRGRSRTSRMVVRDIRQTDASDTGRLSFVTEILYQMARVFTASMNRW